jgi:hypothetical protein
MNDLNGTHVLAIFNPATPTSFSSSNHTLYMVYMIMFWSEIILLIIFFSLALIHVVKGKK